MNYGKRGTKKKQDDLDETGKKQKKRAVLVIKIIVLVLVALIIVGGIVGVKIVRDAMNEAPSVSIEDISPVGFKTTVLDADGNVTAELVSAGANREYVSIEEIPLDLQHAFVAIEDERFYEHNGIDLKGIVRAGVKGVMNGFHFTEGASTITQQLLKNNVFDGWETESESERWTRKFQEWYLATEIEKTEGVTKDVILEKYLNTINLGQNTLGVQTASKRYFGKEVSELTLSECAVLAGITKNPSAYNPISYPENNRMRQETVLKNMLEQEYIDQAQYEEALADDVYSRIQLVDMSDDRTEVNVTSYFVDAMIEDVVEDLQSVAGYSEDDAVNAIYSGGLTIYTTQDPDIQAACDGAANNDENYQGVVKWSFDYNLSIQRNDAEQTVEHLHLNHLINYVKEKTGSTHITYDTQEEAQAMIDEYREATVKEGDTILGERVTFTKQPQVGFTVMDHSTGQVVALVGGRGDKIGAKVLNHAQRAQSPGSTFKIVSTYGPALDLGEITLATAVDNEPYIYEGTDKSVRNVNGRYTGLTSIRESIVDSINVVAVKTLDQISIQTGMDYLDKFGFTTLTDKDYALGTALGGLDYGVTSEELTAAYAAIANKGVYIEPTLYTKVVDHNGNVILEKKPETREVIKETTAFLLIDAMEDVMTSGTGTVARFGGMTLAGKTGTTNDTTDSTFAGFSPYYTCAVWVGNDDNSSMETNRYSRLVWKDAMSRIHEGLEDQGFERPEGLTRVTVCSKTGLLPAKEICEDTHGEYFAKGTAPNKTCDLHQKVKICKESEKLATEYCPTENENVEEKILLKDANLKTEDKKLAIPEETCPIHTEAWYQQWLQQQVPVTPPVTPTPTPTPPVTTEPSVPTVQ